MIDIFRAAQVATDPAGPGQAVMLFGRTVRHHLVTHAAGEGHIDHPTPMHVTQLAPARAVLGPPRRWVKGCTPSRRPMASRISAAALAVLKA